MITEILKEIGSAKTKDDREFLKSLNLYLKGEKLEIFIKDFQNNREGNEAKINENYPNLIQQLSFYYLLLQDINSSIKASYDNKKNKDEIKNRLNVCTKLYNKSLQIFTDMFSLLENGSGLNALLLWRVIYENYAIVNYITNGKEEEAKLFNEYEVVQKNKLLGVKITKEEKEKFAKKYGRDFDSNEYCWAKFIRGKKSFLKIIRSIKEKKFYKYYLLSNNIGRSNAFSVNNGIVYNEKAGSKATAFSSDDVTKGLSIFISVLTEFAGIMIDNYIDDKKSKETLKKMVVHFGKQIDRKWKKITD